MIFKLIIENPIHPSANWIYKKACQKMPKISLGTIYRNLNQLSNENLIKELSFGTGKSRYDANLKPHHHIKCTICGKIDDIEFKTDCDINNKLKDMLTESLHYTNITCEVLVTGICKDCQEANKNN